MRPPSGQDAVGAMWYKTVLQDTVCPYPDATQYSSKPRGFAGMSPSSPAVDLYHFISHTPFIISSGRTYYLLA